MLFVCRRIQVFAYYLHFSVFIDCLYCANFINANGQQSFVYFMQNFCHKKHFFFLHLNVHFAPKHINFWIFHPFHSFRSVVGSKFIFNISRFSCRFVDERNMNDKVHTKHTKTDDFFTFCSSNHTFDFRNGKQVFGNIL